METYRVKKDRKTRERFLEVSLRGSALIENPVYNKGTSFTARERTEFGLEGLLPCQVSTIEQQLSRVYENYCHKTDDLERFIHLSALQDRNETLFFRLLLTHLEEMAPIVYTPTVGLACQKFSHIYRRPRGLYITPEHSDRRRMERVLRNASFDDIRIIVVTDNERILGLGDQGVGGMGIPVGKLTLYVAGAGFHPTQTLPICLDVGTDNQELLNDPLYLGYRKPRLRGQEYDALIETFVQGVLKVFPGAILQWEDFKKANAFRLLDRYKDRLPSFNDDIQGTAAVVHAGICSALRITGGKLREQGIVMLGAGAAGVGILRQLRAAMMRDGLNAKEVANHCMMVDSQGLVLSDRPDLEPHKKEFSASPDRVEGWRLADSNHITLEDVIRNVKPTILLGTSGQPGVFSESLVRQMGLTARQPVIFPLSNPTSKSEAIPQQLMEWTMGRALIATGSPFPDVVWEGESYPVSQGNNIFIFPGVGLGASVAKVRHIHKDLFLAAASALAEAVPAERLSRRALYPRIADLRSICRIVAVAVATAARDLDLTEEKLSDEDIAQRVDAAIWSPEYLPYRPE